MKVNFYATLRQIVGQKEVDFDLDENATVNTLIELVLRSYPDLRPELLDENGNMYPQVHVLVNGRDTVHLKDRLDTHLTSGDLVSIFPAVGGGTF